MHLCLATRLRLVLFLTTAALASAPEDFPLRADELDTRPLSLHCAPALTQVAWSGWDTSDDSGTATSFRPILVTHAGDNTGRLFVVEQRGTLHLLPAGRASTASNVFLNIQEQVAYHDKTNEEGLLGLAFHPRFQENGEFFVYYTNRADKHQNVVARFRTRPDNPQQADPDSQQILLVLDKPFWNHDGGTLAFGPDGYLYIAIGDGGAANDPLGNGQNLNTLLGKILRIDVDHRDGDRPYAIPADNPFAGRADARGEIWAYGLRNVWRFAFDRANGRLWAADVGQDTWEEIDLIERGGNYGWNIREGLHPFEKRSPQSLEHDYPAAMLLDPIWEYHHDLGKSITGGFVYRGRQFPELNGAYLYADYVSGMIWALWYDDEQRRVTANRSIATPQPIPVMSFGEDAAGEVFITMAAVNGQGIFELAR